MNGETMESKVHGFVVHSDMIIPGLVPQAARHQPDITIRAACPPGWLLNAAELPRDERSRPVTRLPEHGVDIIRLPDGQRFAIDADGHRVWVISADADIRSTEVDEALTTMLGFAACRRGRSVLHGVALDMEGAAIVLIGKQEIGKSTIAGAMCADSARVLAEDGVAFSVNVEGILVHGGVRKIRLRPRSGENNPDWVRSPDNRYLDSPDGLASAEPEGLPLQTIFALEDSDDRPYSWKCGPAEAFAKLLPWLIVDPCSYEALDRPVGADEVARAASSIPVWRVGVVKDRIEETVGIIQSALSARNHSRRRSISLP